MTEHQPGRLPEVHLRTLRYFAVAAQEENFSRAADRLNVAQPALSRRIRDLEGELGVELFERRRRRVQLSGAGRAFFEDTRQILLDIERASARARRVFRGETGIISLGVNDSALRHEVIGRVLNAFHLEHADVAMKLGATAPLSLVDAVTSGHVDGAFAYTRPPGAPALDHLEVARDRFVLALPAAHRLADAAEIRLADLRGEEFLWMPRDSAPFIYDRMIEACRAGGLVPRIRQELLPEGSRLRLVAEGLGLTFVTSSFAGFLSEDIVLRPVADFSLDLTLEFIWRQDNGSPSLNKFLAVLRRDAQTG